MIFNKNYNSGYIALISVLVLGAVSLSITVSLLSLGVINIQTTIDYQSIIKARSLGHACAEEALEKIMSDFSFSGTGNLSFGPDDCDYEIINNGGEDRIIRASGNVGSSVRRVLVEIDSVNPFINIVSWQEVVDW